MRLVLKAALLILGALILSIGIALPFAFRAVDALEGARIALAAAINSLSADRNIGEAAAHLERAAEEFNRVKKNIGRVQYLRAVPWVGRQVKAAYAGGVAAHLAVGAFGRAIVSAKDAASILASMTKVRVGDIPRQERMVLLESLNSSLPDLQETALDLERAKEILKRAPKTAVVSALRSRLEELDRYVAVSARVFSDILPLLQIGPTFLGYPDPQTYLVLLQNSDEMRPTGGFIGTYGLMRFDTGHITEFFTDDVYNLDRFVPGRTRPPAPDPVRRYLQQPYWYLRDANWDPDFEASAKRILQFYDEEVKYQKGLAAAKSDPDKSREPGITPIHSRIENTADLAGVIAIMPEAIRPILELTGPIDVRGQTFTAENLTDALEYEVEIGFEQKGIPRPQRKEIIAELGHALIAKIFELPVNQWPEILHSARQALDEKHFLIYFTDPEAQSKIETLGWSGKIVSPAQDYLSVFDANLFSLKTDPYVARTIFYRATKDQGGRLIGEVEIVYAYPRAGPAWKTKGYRSFTRVYVPKGSILTSASGALTEEFAKPGAVELTQEFDKTGFGAFVAVQVGEVKRLRFTYRLPDTVAAPVQAGVYELLVQKQPGTLGHGLTVALDFGKVPQVWNPRGLNVSRQGSQLTWQTDLIQDQQFRVEF
ncbi:DUF4012 domain-containing protein [Candidatus Uhrbacteria bacterium]|nr:DUF4012 domain-containing protein [Candidatus Uhrbacteria bacterium]